MQSNSRRGAERREWRSVAALAAIGLAVAALLTTACNGGGDDEAAPAEPTPTPTAEPRAADSFQPITADLEQDPLAFFAAIPAFERNCLVQSVGAARFDEIAEGAEPTLEEGEDLLACISGSTAGRFVAGALITQTSLESLTLDTLDCMAPRFVEMTPSDLFDGIAGLSGDGPLSDPSGLFSAALQPVIEALFCLNEEERTAVDAEIAAAGGGDFSLTVGQMECVHESLGGEGLAGVFGGSQTIPLNVFSALADCGVTLGGLSGALPVPSPAAAGY